MMSNNCEACKEGLCTAGLECVTLSNPHPRKGHYCYEWDEMWITEDDPEFDCCTCELGE